MYNSCTHYTTFTEIMPEEGKSENTHIMQESKKGIHKQKTATRRLKYSGYTFTKNSKNKVEIRGINKFLRGNIELSWLVVLGGYKRHLGNHPIIRLSSNHNLDISPCLVVTCFYVSHCYVLLQTRAETTTGDFSNILSI